MTLKASLTAAVLVIGDELLSGRQDTNGPALEALLAAQGIEPRVRVVLGDNVDLSVRHLRLVMQAHSVVITCGGLGPTQDDITRQAVAQALNRELTFLPRAWRDIQARFKRMQRPLPETNRAQAMIPEGAQMLPNPWGTAPGFIVQQNGCWIASLPGPPVECLPMFEQEVMPRLRKNLQLKGASIHRGLMRTSGIAESKLQELLGPLFLQAQGPELGFLLDEPGEILVILTVRGSDAATAKKMLRQGYALVQKQLGDDLVGPAECSLPQRIGELLRARRETLAVAESCTGGLISRRLTAIPGSSRYFREGAVTYSNLAKQNRLGIPAALLARHGAVSEPVAAAMALGMKQTSGSEWALAVTGVAGPGGGTKVNPVGTVCFALCGPDGYQARQKQYMLGDRDLIQRRSATLALDWLRRCLGATLKDKKKEAVYFP